jgi:hypothetical protein
MHWGLTRKYLRKIREHALGFDKEIFKKNIGEFVEEKYKKFLIL